MHEHHLSFHPVTDLILLEFKNKSKKERETNQEKIKLQESLRQSQISSNHVKITENYSPNHNTETNATYHKMDKQEMKLLDEVKLFRGCTKSSYINRTDRGDYDYIKYYQFNKTTNPIIDINYHKIHIYLLRVYHFYKNRLI